MKKLKNIKFGKISNYFKELSIVIIGVAVTLYASSVITKRNDRKDLNLQLNAIYTELEDNLQRVDNLLEHYYRIGQFRKYLLEDYNNPGQVTDSIIRYADVFGNTQTFVYKKGAYEMFMNSGAMKLLSDRALLLDITECYAMLETTKVDHDLYTALKMDLFKSIYNLDTEIVLKNEDFKRHLNLYNFHIAVVISGGDAKDAKKQIEKVLARHEVEKK